MIISQIIGYLGRDAEIKQINPSLGVVSFSVACDYYDAQRQKSTKWVRCTKFFDGTNTPVVAQWLKKGTRVFCQGNMKPGGVFTNKTTGEQYENWDLTIAHLELLGNKGEPGTQQQPSLPAPQSAGNQQMSGRPLTPNEVYQQAISRPVPETDLPF